MSAFQRQEQRARKEAAEYRAKVERYRRLFERVQADQNRISRGDPHGGRLLKKKMTQAEFREWADFALELRQRAYDKELSFEEYETEIRK